MHNLLFRVFFTMLQCCSSKTDLELCFEVLEHVLIVFEFSMETLFSSMMLAPAAVHLYCNATPLKHRQGFPQFCFVSFFLFFTRGEQRWDGLRVI